MGEEEETYAMLADAEVKSRTTGDTVIWGNTTQNRLSERQ